MAVFCVSFYTSSYCVLTEAASAVMFQNFEKYVKRSSVFNEVVTLVLQLYYKWIPSKVFFKTVCSNYVTYMFQSESTLYGCLNIKQLFARNRHDSWSLSDCNGIRTHSHLVLKRTLSHLVVVGSNSVAVT